MDIREETITSDDLTGTGSKDDPYVVHSTRGFLWITNYSRSKKTLWKKFLKLNCDVFLNDEIFDEDGNPVGGDGEVYCWTKIDTDCGDLSFDGNGHTIHGLYINSPEGQYVGLFGYAFLEEVRNLDITNFYVYAKWYSSVLCGFEIKTIVNCAIREGFLIVEQERASGFCQQATNVINSQNYATIKTINDNRIAGLIMNLKKGGKIRDCQNYGKISNIKGEIGGIVHSSNPDCVIEDCTNYGELSCLNAKGNYVGGIISDSLNGHFINCNNYGKIAGNISGGIAAQQRTTCEFLNCGNYGEIVSEIDYRNGGLVGRFYSSNYDIKAVIKNFVQRSSTNNSVVGMMNNMTHSIEIDISNVRCEYKGDSQTDIYCLLGENDKDNAKICVSNFYVVCDKAQRLALVRNAYEFEILFSNILFEVNDVKIITNFVKGWGAEKKIACDGGFVISHKNGVSKYYGDDFSGFFVNLKTGKVELKALNGKGLFQGKVDENVLRYKGYEKLEI